ncbi:anionic trypsin-2 isoform X1 [Anabrus simplex]|uniref:anionic trypsin-2 isoform X1 n=1 Tax=Anabrus simplex TaxID=316456 RepID=UPI0035A377ED
MDKQTLWIVLTVFAVKTLVVDCRRSPKEDEYLGQPELARIVGGVFVKPNQIPYQVRVRIHTNSTVWNCGGSIISRRYVLTVAHCLRKEAIKRIEVLAGVVDMTNRALISLDVTNKILHEKLPDQNIANDIALLKVARPFPVGLPNVKAIRLREDTGFFSTWCTASGWGEAYDDMDPDMLKLIHIPLTTKAVCDKTYGTRDDVICAGWLKQGGKDTCQGDSGGPLVCEGLLTGIIKAGKGCAKPDYPGTYTEVAYYVPWIKKILAENREYYSDGDIQYHGEEENSELDQKCDEGFDVSSFRLGFSHCGDYTKVTMTF